MQGLKKNQVRSWMKSRVRKKDNLLPCLFRRFLLKKVEPTDDARALAELQILEADGASKHTRWGFFGKQFLPLAVDRHVAARARVVVELADAAQLRAAGAWDGDERRQHHPPDHDAPFPVEERQHLVGDALHVVGRAVAVDQLPGLLLVLGGSHGLGLVLRRQVSLPERRRKTE